uniref:Hexosyltransferase n=1 Tax=Globodera rostochiensis TaxID=31243 RepID=A0A914I412_GLORO
MEERERAVIDELLFSHHITISPIHRGGFRRRTFCLMGCFFRLPRRLMKPFFCASSPSHKSHRLRSTSGDAVPLKQFLFGVLIGFLFFVVLRQFYATKVAKFRHNSFVPPPIEDGPLMNNDFILVGVLSAQRFLDTRALQIWRSWARRVPGRVLFFVAEGTVLSSRVRAARMPVVVLRGVDDAYPPQKKAFAMLRWMFDNQLTNFHWFMRADDDLYVRTEALKLFLIGQDPDRAHFIGQAGLGNSLEYGQLSLGAQDNYCMGGPGVLLSRETLRQLGPHLEQCLRHLVTNHEDVELGRCVRRHVGIACTWNYEMQTLFHNNASAAGLLFMSASNGAETTASRGDASGARALLRRLITLHPVKRAEAMRRVHLHAEALLLTEKRQMRADLLGMLEEMRARRSDATRRGDEGFGGALGVIAEEGEGARFSGLLPLVENELKNSMSPTASLPLYWDYISPEAKLLFCAHRPNCPRHTLEASWRRSLNEVISELFDRFNSDAHHRGRTLHFQNIQYGYVRVRPLHGVDMVLDMALWYRRFHAPQRSALAVRRHAYVQRRFGPIDARVNFVLPLGDDSVSPAVRTPIIHFVVALKGRPDTFERFARNLLELSKANRRNGTLQLVLVMYSSAPDEDRHINATLDRLISCNFPALVLRMPADAVFSRGAALSAGASLLSSDALLFVTDVDVLVHPDAIDRIRLNTVRNHQVYFPIVFSEFSPRTWFNISQQVEAVHQQQQHYQTQPPSSSHFVYSQRRGYFRHFGFGIMSIFRSDFDTIGQFNRTLRGWGLEDVDMFEKIVKSRILHPFRVPDPGLVHVFHPIDCVGAGQNAAQRAACEGTRAQSFASVDFLVEQFGPYL